MAEDRAGVAVGVPVCPLTPPIHSLTLQALCPPPCASASLGPRNTLEVPSAHRVPTAGQTDSKSTSRQSGGTGRQQETALFLLGQGGPICIHEPTAACAPELATAHVIRFW